MEDNEVLKLIQQWMAYLKATKRRMNLVLALLVIQIVLAVVNVSLSVHLHHLIAHLQACTLK